MSGQMQIQPITEALQLSPRSRDPHYAEPSKQDELADALKVVVRREQILPYFYILSIKIRFGNMK